jgi:putative tryptophan/tyrosine transport system substrate-binding protein
LEVKRLELLHEIVPEAASFGVLVNPASPDVDFELDEAQKAAGVIKRQIYIARANAESEIETAFATLAHQSVGALLVAADPLFASQSDQLVALAARYKLPTIYFQREIAEMGGLVSCAPDYTDEYRQTGIYVGKILKGAKPGKLPVVRPTKFDLVINLRTAKDLGLTIPAGILSIADKVIQ